MSFLKAVFFMLPLMAIASVGLTYVMYTQSIEPRFNDAILKMEQNTEDLKQISTKLDVLLGRP